MGAHGQEDWFDEVMPGLDAVRAWWETAIPMARPAWEGRRGRGRGPHQAPYRGACGRGDGDRHGAHGRGRLTAGMVSANRRERLADASAACERSARTWSAGSAEWGRDRDGSWDRSTSTRCAPLTPIWRTPSNGFPPTPSRQPDARPEATRQRSTRTRNASPRPPTGSRNGRNGWKRPWRRPARRSATPNRHGQEPARTCRGRRAGPAGGEHGGPVQGAVPVPSARTAHGTGGGAARRRVRVPGGHGPALPGHRLHGLLARPPGTR